MLGGKDRPNPLCRRLHRIVQHGVAIAFAEQDLIARCGKASLAIVDADEVDGPGYTTHFRSVIAFGRIRLITDAREKMETAMMLGARYNPGVDQEKVLTGQMAASFAHMHMIALDIDEMTGKESKHFATQRCIEKSEERA